MKKIIGLILVFFMFNAYSTVGKPKTPKDLCQLDCSIKQGECFNQNAPLNLKKERDGCYKLSNNQSACIRNATLKIRKDQNARLKCSKVVGNCYSQCNLLKGKK